MTWKPPQAFEEYKLIELLGRGGMGAVYLARDTILDRAVAIKFIAVDADQQARDRFVIEARAIARVQHPNVVAIYRVGEVEGRPFIVSELVRGKRLDLLAGSLSSEGLVDIAIQLCRGLAAAHRRGVLHRDLKPENAILAEGGEVKLLDFGIAKLTGEPERLSKASGFLAWNESTAILDGVPPGAPPSPASPARPANRTAPDLASATLPAGEKAAADLDVTASIPSLAAVAGTSFRPGERAGDDRPPEDWWAGAASSPSPSPTHDGAVMGTPFYIAPEVWGGAPASPRADVYSLGATLFMLAAGRPPHQGDSIYAIADKACRQDAPPVADAAPFLSDPVAAIIDRCLVRDPGGRFADGDAVREAFETLTAVRAQDKLPAGNPYRGLAAFEAAHQGLFFGRGREVRAVIERVRSGPWVLVAGDSGVGKSSLLRAGVLPAIAQGSLGDGRDYLTMTMMPSHAPWTTFIARLGATLGLDDLEADDDPMPIARSLARRLGDDLGVMVLIDQLEELVTLSDPEESALLAQALILLGQTVPGLHVACTVRADFLTRVSALPGIGETMDSALYLLRPMDEDGVREAIVGPARALGVSFESADIVDELAAAVAGAGGLPLLQFCLAELWQRHDRDAKQITRQSLDDLGGVDGALSNHADAVIADLRPGQKQAARTLLVKLVATSGTRERLSETELCGASDDARAALNALVRGRLVTARDAEAGSELEIAHEALIASWKTLVGWLSEDAGRRAVMERLRAAAREWKRLGGAREALWQARQLGELAGLAPGDLGADEAAFAAASRRHLRRQKLFKGAAVAMVMVLIAGVYAAVRIHNDRQLAGKVAAEIAAAKSAMAQAHELVTDENTLRDAAFAAFDGGDWDTANGRWAEALERTNEIDDLLGQASTDLEQGLMLDPDRDDTRALLAQTIFRRLLRAARDHRDQSRDELSQRLAVYDDGSLEAELLRPALVTITSKPAGATVTAARYEARDGLLVVGPSRPLGTTPLSDLELARGSYLLVFAAAGRQPVRYPVAIERAENLAITVPLPRAGSIPDGYVYIPPGRFLFGTADANSRDFLGAVPLHHMTTPGYLISKTEVTFADYIRFLDASSPRDREKFRPHSASIGVQGSVDLARGPDGRWTLTIQPTGTTYSAAAGDPIHYRGRAKHAVQNWLKLPVSGISFAHAEAYAAWLDRTGQVPGARLCNEHEWERAARGADDRLYPHGNRLAPGDANFDATYDMDPSRYGPDEVGSHPLSTSPFGLVDMSGNVWEFARSSKAGQIVARGGAFAFNETPSRVNYREPIDALVSDITLGVRVCADPPIP